MRLFWRGLSNKDYLYRWNERLGFSDSRPSEDLPVIWLHAVSVGEVNASIPLLRALISDFPNSEYIVTTTTPTGSAILLDKMGSKVRHQYMPVDLPLCLDKFLDTWKPKALIILETEIWPNLISHCKNRGIFTALVNARLSEKSKNKYSQPLVKSLVTSTIEGIDLILAQFQSDLLRFEELSKGINISLCGNLKFDQEVPEEIDSIISTIKADWSIEGKERPVLIAASTHELEETIILEAFHGIKDVLSDALLVLVPRHPERFKKILNLIKDEGFASQYGDLGPVYGKQWRDFEGVDQLEQVIEDIKNSPDSRRLIVSAWNPKDIPVMIKSGLPPCHTLFQFYVSNGRLSCQLYQRSADVFLGVPYNISSYALLTLMIAKVTGLEPGEFVHSFGDTHIYLNHLEQVEEQLSREPHSLPQLKIKNNRSSLFEFKINDFELKEYDPHPFISAPIAI